MRINLFNDQSYIEVVDFAAMGNRGEYCGDWAVVDGARVSFGRKAAEFPFEKNKELAGYLWDATDLSPFAQFIVQTRVRMPVHIALPWLLFPYGEYNEISGRYTKSVGDLDRCFVPPEFPQDLAELLRTEFASSNEMYKTLYDTDGFERGEKQVAKELARSSLLFSFLTEFIFTVSLRKLAHFKAMFVNHPLFTEINEALFSIVKTHAPLFSERFRPFWNDIKSRKGAFSQPGDIHFETKDCGILDDDFSALKLLGARGSDKELADLARDSRGYRGGDYEVIKELVRGSKRDDLPQELTEMGIRLALRVPIYIFRQMYRHKRAAWYGLKILPNNFYIPREWRAQTKGSRYVFEPFPEEENKTLTRKFSEYVSRRKEFYQGLIKHGVKKEWAERFLPYCFYMSVFRSSDGIELFNFLNLRCDWHAQLEHQKYALKTAELFAAHFPLTFLNWYEEYWTGKNEKIDQLYQSIKKS